MSFDKDTKIKLLEDTLKLFGKNGERWAKHQYRTLDGQFCLAGGVGETAVREGLASVQEDTWGDEIFTIVSDGTEFDQFGDFSDWLTEQISLEGLAQEKGWHSIPAFNDNGDTKFDDVRALIEERITQLGGESK